jgi:hypothetical protein
MIRMMGNMKVKSRFLVSRIREHLDDHPHFRGRTALLQIEAIGRSIVVSGRVPTYYLKQLLQEAIKAVPDVARIDNRVDVTAEYPQYRKPEV